MEAERKQIDGTVEMVRELAAMGTGAAIGVDIRRVPCEVFDGYDAPATGTLYACKTLFSDGQGSYVHIYREEPYMPLGSQRIEKAA